MLNPLRNIDTFSKNIIIVFIGASLVNFFNFLYQLLIAHKFSAADFAAFNALLSIFMVFSSTLGTLQTAISKYSAAFNAKNEIFKVKFLLRGLLRKSAILAIFTLLIFWFISNYIIDTLKISSAAGGYILAMLLASCWLTPVFSGGIQGLGLFKWLAAGLSITGLLKLTLAFIFILMGFNIAGALGALLASSLITMVIFYFPLRRFLSLKGEEQEINPALSESNNRLSFRKSGVNPGVDYKEIFLYLFPVATSYFCFMALVNFDMVLVRYFFLPQDSGLYSLAQMVGKVFLFLPGAISIVMFPTTSGLKAKNMDTISTLQRSLLYAAVLCLIAGLVYNLFPALILKFLTGKVYPECIILGRLFSVSMSFFVLLFILIAYFLSLGDLRFIKYLVLFTCLQFFAIFLFHQNLFQIQGILCLNAISLFLIHLGLVFKSKIR